MSDSVERFSNRVENYVKFRPDYPREIIAHLMREGALSIRDTIADIGCGTGIAARMFLENGNAVYGVEPNDGMRAAAVEYLAKIPGFTPVKGSSAATGLPDASIDLIVAAQAFHWFEPDAARLEFRRILKPGGGVVLIWNERQLDTTPFLVDYEQFLLAHATDYSLVRHDTLQAKELEGFFQSPIRSAVFSNLQVFDFAGLKGRLLSASYMPDQSDPRYPPLVNSLAQLFAKHERNGRIEVFYDTKVYFSRPFYVSKG